MNPSITNPITEDDIANYLANTPEFFLRHAELLAAVQLTSPHSHRAVSLQERQAEMLREKIKLLEQRVMDMVRNGADNTVVSDKILHWARTLLLHTDLASLPAQITQDIERQFAVPQVGLRLWGLASDYATLEATRGVSEDAQVFAASLAEPFCGLNTGFEAVAWLDAPQAAQSVALLPLRAADVEATGPAFGLLILASDDAARFTTGMGTDLLARIGELASAALSRLR